MSERQADVEAFLDAASRLAGLELTKTSRVAVRENLQLLFTMASQFEDQDMDPAVDPAPVFRP